MQRVPRMMAVMGDAAKISYDRVLERLRAFYAGHAASGGEGAEDAAIVSEALARPPAWAPPPAAEAFAATRHFLPALERAASGPLADLAEALRAAAPHLNLNRRRGT